jgi:DNA-binding response OmpR family regulator
LLKRHKTDRSDGDDGPAPRRVLIAGADDDASRVYAGVVSSYDIDAVPARFDDALSELRDGQYGCVVLVGTAHGETAAFKQLAVIRNSDHTHVRRTGVVMLAAPGREVAAWEAGVDGFLVMPADAGDLVADLNQVLDRSRTERADHRQAMLEAARRR